MSTVACKLPEMANSRLKSTVEGPNKYVCVCVHSNFYACADGDEYGTLPVET